MSKARRLCLFLMVPVDAALDRSLNRTDLCVLGILHSFWGSTGHAYPSIAGLCKRCNSSESPIHKALAKLKKIGWVKIKDNPGSRSTYLPGRLLISGSSPKGGGVDFDTPVVDDTQVDQHKGGRKRPPLPPRTDEYWRDDGKVKNRPLLGNNPL